MKELRCKGCNKYLGIVRDGSLHKNITCLCVECDEKTLKQLKDYKSVVEMYTSVKKENVYADMFGDFFNKKSYWSDL